MGFTKSFPFFTGVPFTLVMTSPPFNPAFSAGLPGSTAITLKELGAPYGVVIMAVEPGSPAEKAGLKGGDVITSVNGTPVKNGNDLVNPIAQAPIGSKVKLTYVRDRVQKDATAVVEDRTRVFPTQAGRLNNCPDECATAETS